MLKKTLIMPNEYQEMEARSGVDNLRSDVAQAEDQLQDAKQELERFRKCKNASAEEIAEQQQVVDEAQANLDEAEGVNLVRLKVN